MAVRPKLRRRRRTKIIATLGPASATPEILARLFQAGADVFRLNFSHGTHEDHAARFAMIREMEDRFERPIGILADVQGPKLRVGRFSGGRVFLQTGQQLQLDLNPTPGSSPPTPMLRRKTRNTNNLKPLSRPQLRSVKMRNPRLPHLPNRRLSTRMPRPSATAQAPRKPGQDPQITFPLRRKPWTLLSRRFPRNLHPAYDPLGPVIDATLRD